MMEQEINAAVEWWTQQLQTQAKHDADDGEINLFATVVAATFYTPLSAEKIEAFRLALHMHLTAFIESSSPKLDDPMWGSALRCFGTDYHPGDVLSKAADDADINRPDLRFPIKTLMWIDPGSVTVKCGYGAARETIYPKESRP